MAMLSFKQFESNCHKKEPCKHDCNWVKFSYYLNFGYCKYGIIIFQFKLKMAVHTTSTNKKKVSEVNNFCYIFKKS